MTDEELIRAVAEALFPDRYCGIVNGKVKMRDEYGNSDWYDFDPLTDANDRDMVVDRMRELGYEFNSYSWGNGRYRFHFNKYMHDYYSVNESIGRAVCNAALQAVRAQDG